MAEPTRIAAATLATDALRDADMLRELAETTARFTGDEPAVLAVLEECHVSVAERLRNARLCVSGAATYGAYHCDTEARCMPREGGAEQRDARFYWGAEIVRLRRLDPTRYAAPIRMLRGMIATADVLAMQADDVAAEIAALAANDGVPVEAALRAAGER